jgi:hypothetical protein
MAGEDAGNIENFVSSVVVNHPRLGRVRMNTASYDAATCGPIVEGPTLRPNSAGLASEPLKDPKVDDEGRVIADLPSG